MRRELKDSVIVITGASAGIGEALAAVLSAAGAKLVLAARRGDRLEALNALLGGRHLCAPTDVSKKSDCEALISRVFEHFGRIDTLVCNAGYGLLRPVAETSHEELLAMFQTNLFGTLDCIRPAVPVMARQDLRDGVRGQIMIVSSAVARRGIPYFGGYSATKSAQLSLAEALRVELRDQQIAVTTVHPVGTDTEFTVAAQRVGNTRKRIGASKGEIRQTPQAVAAAMVKAIVRPRPEVWPLQVARWMLAVGSLVPGSVDKIMAKRVAVQEDRE